MFSKEKPKLGNLSFKKPEYQDIYSRQGYVKAPLFKDEELEKIKAVFKSHISVSKIEGVYDSMDKETPSTISSINESIVKIVEPIFKEHLNNFSIICSVFFVKSPEVNSKVGIHIDPSFTSRQFNQLGIWIPLVEINEQTGSFFLLKNSQKLTSGYYNPSMPSPFQNIEKNLEPLFDEVNLKKGEVLFFHNQMLHYTGPNKSNQERIALIIKIIDENAPLVTAHLDIKAGKVNVYKHKANVFLNGDYASNTIPKDSEKIGHSNYRSKVYSKEDLLSIKKKIRS